MIDFINKNNYMILFLLSIILFMLIVLRKLLLKNLNYSGIKVEKDSIIGKKEIREVCSEVVSSNEGSLAVLADGLGKNEAGRISSQVAVKTFTRLFLNQLSIEKIEYFFRRAFIRANSEILKRIDNNQGGTSVASVIISNNFLYYASVGDSIISVFRNGELIKISEGHTFNMLAKREFYKGNISKEIALGALKEKKLIYYLGQEGFDEIEMFETPIRLQKGDIVVLMNKGIYKGMSWIELEQIIKKNKNLKVAVHEIIETVKENDTKDENNGSIVLIKYI